MQHLDDDERDTITDDGATLHAKESGAGKPLLLLHGLMGTGDDWTHVFDLEELSRTWRVLRPDARGHGRSTAPSGTATFRRFGLDVLHWMDHLGLRRVRAVGMSLGAKTLLHAATLEPARFEALVLVSPAPRFPEPTRALFRTAAATPPGDAQLAALHALHPRGDDQIAALLQLPARFAEDAADMAFDRARLGTITARTLIVAGDQDPLYPLDLAHELHEGIVGSELDIVEGGGHGPIFTPEERARFAPRALRFLGDGT